MFCSECGQHNEVDAKFCTNCGKKFLSAKTAPPSSSAEQSSSAKTYSTSATPTYVHVELKDSGTVTAMSVIGFVFGLIGMMGSFIPCIGSLAFYIGIPAALISALGLFIAYSQQAKKTFAVVAVTISLIGVVISGWQYFSIVSAGKNAERELKKMFNQEQQPEKRARSQTKTNTESFAQAQRDFEAHRIEQARNKQLREKSRVPSLTIGTYPCFNLHFNEYSIPPTADGNVVLTDVNASYIHVFPNEAPYKTNVVFSFDNITGIIKKDIWGTFNIHFNLRNAVRIRDGDGAYFIRFKDATVRDICFNKLIAAKEAWDKKYPTLR